MEYISQWKFSKSLNFILHYDIFGVWMVSWCILHFFPIAFATKIELKTIRLCAMRWNLWQSKFSRNSMVYGKLLYTILLLLLYAIFAYL